VTLFHGDCLALLRQIPDEAAQLVVTSPPYNVGKSYERRVSFDDYMAHQQTVISECVRIIKPGGSICWQVGHHVNGHGQIIPLDLALHPMFVAHTTLRLRNRIIWHFEHGLNCTYRFSGRHETILWYTKGNDYMFKLDAVRVPQKYPGKRAYKGPRRGSYSSNPLGKNPGDVWVFPNVKGNHIEKTMHPCQFPVELPERLVLALTSPGDLVVDPYLGVGTSAVAAVINRRRAAGADLIREYLAIARTRVAEAAKGKLRYRPRGTPIHVPKPNTPLTSSPFAITAPAS
jgi:adenine-specific DNA-methyltransferase